MNINNPGSVTATIGPPFISIVLNWGLFGALSIQVYLYSQAFPQDRLGLKLLVYGIYALETTQTFLLTERVWHTLEDIGNAQALDVFAVESWIAVCILGGIVALLVQIFYAYRIRGISESRYIPLVIIFMSVASFVGALGSGVYIEKVRYLSHLLDHKAEVYTLAGLWLGGGAVCDVLIAASMCYYLQKRAKDIPFQSTQRLISKIVRLTIETGTLTASLSVFSLALFCVRSLIKDWEAPLSATAKLYSTTLLAVLNSRIKLIPASESDNMITWSLDTSTRSNIAFRAPESLQLRVQASTTRDDGDITGKTSSSTIVIGKDFEAPGGSNDSFSGKIGETVAV